MTDTQRRETVARGHRISYLTAGDGPPLVLVSGGAQEALVWVEDGFVDSLAQSYRVVVPDLLGHGQSDMPHDAAAYREPDVALDVLAVLDAEGIQEPVNLWGYSRGSRLAYMLAVEAPHRVRSIVAGGTAVSVPDELVRAFTQPLVAPLREADWDTYWATFGAPMDEPARRRIEAGTQPEAFAAIWQGMAEQPYPFDLSKVQVPCLVYVGEQDVFAAIVGEDVRRLGADLHIFEGLNHNEAYQRRDLIEGLALAHFAKSA